MSYTLKLVKTANRRLDKGVCRQQVAHAINRALAGKRAHLWSAGKIRLTEEANGQLGYTAAVSFTRIGRNASPEILDRQFARMLEIAHVAVRSRGWFPPDASRPEPATTEPGEPAKPQSGYADVRINTDPTGYFSHLYERDAQVEMVLSAVRRYVESDFADRFHGILYGPPACGKTEVLRSLARMVGSDAVLHFDATSTTKAGAERTLLETADIPPILCIEEIEKTDEHSLRWLLGVLDFRGEVRKVTHRSTAVREVKLLCLATVNDMDLFKRIMDGALASRFTHKIKCPRPSRDALEKILLREIGRTGGDLAWIKPALDWCVDEEKTNDPRRIIAVCLCGGDKLLTGEYQEYLRATM